MHDSYVGIIYLILVKVRSPVALKRLKSLRDKIPDILTTLLAVIDAIACPYDWDLDL